MPVKDTTKARTYGLIIPGSVYTGLIRSDTKFLYNGFSFFSEQAKVCILPKIVGFPTLFWIAAWAAIHATPHAPELGLAVSPQLSG